MTKMILTEEGKKWMVKNYPPGIVWDYDPEKTFTLLAVDGKGVFHITQDGIPMGIPTLGMPHPLVHKAPEE